ncbi:MAG TPA: YciI family protein [Thermoplasmata archaeon]|nr:YciI family protein [Thermoplasmata archaeon]
MAPESEHHRLPEMTHYVFGLFRRVPNRPDLPEEEGNRIQEGHMEKLRQLTERGELITAGPFEEDTDVRGVLVFSTGSVERARELMQDDAAIVNGRLVLDLYSWFAPAGLRVVSPVHTTAPPEP